MASQQKSENAMIIQYEWVFANVEKVPKTFASKMICFRGLKVFRLGLKNLVTSPFLFFVALDLNKIGMRVEEVSYGIQDSESAPSTMSQIKQEDIGDNGNLQLFKTNITKQVIGNCTFVFRICIKGSDSGYSYRLCDRLAKDQLRAAAKSKNGADVEFVVKGKTISAHKAILAARSPVFAAIFTKEQTVGDASKNQTEPNSNKRKRRNDGLHQIRIDGVKPSTVEEFLDFIYTGESVSSVSSLANEELLKLAVKYKLKTLIRLCRAALMAIDATQMAKLIMNGIHDNTEAQYSSTIK
jgi:speckle-type POZ protein